VELLLALVVGGAAGQHSSGSPGFVPAMGFSLAAGALGTNLLFLAAGSSLDGPEQDEILLHPKKSGKGI